MNCIILNRLARTCSSFKDNKSVCRTGA
uniref:Uncharacterized protein n=1 Tax=Anguilla anguilla TaxID=7936 RepID=A0A0E9V857_ANGAN